MANTYTISIPDELKAYVDKLANERKLSELISMLLAEYKEKEKKR